MMKTIFDKEARAEIMSRIDTLSNDSQSQWGKMNVYQMVKHCSNWDDWILGTKTPAYKQEFIGFVFGKIALKGIMKDDGPLKRGMPAGKKFNIKETTGDVELQKKIWIDRIAAYEHFSNPDFIHDFFGKMTREQIGILAYKHSDHHLRQFGA